MESNAVETKKTQINLGRDYKAERFQFVLSVNGFIICQRYFRINGFNPLSLSSVELKETIDQIVNDVIVKDMQSKTRTYMHYDYDPTRENSEYHRELEDPWAVTFKFAFIVDDKEIISRIWDGTVFPRYIREHVDLVNKKGFFENFEGRMNWDTWIAYKMVIDRPDLSYIIINLLCDVCSTTFSSRYVYTVDDEYRTTEKTQYGEYKEVDKRTYCLNEKFEENREIQKLERALSAKTKAYLKELEFD